MDRAGRIGALVAALGALVAVGLVLLDVGVGEGGSDQAATADVDGAGAIAQKPAARSLWPKGQHRLVAIRRGARVPIYASPGEKPRAMLRHHTEFGSKRVLSVLSRRRGWLRVSSELSARGRSMWMRIDEERMRFSYTPLSLHADLSERVVELREGDRVVRSFAVAIGAAGTDTPPGRFAVTDVIVGGLNPVYGCCAIALTARQPSMPRGWIGGDRIAIHGTTGPVGSASSNGCLRASDEDARALSEILPLGTPVFITA